MNKTPSFWYPKNGRISLKALMLWPLTLLWRLGALLKKITTSPYQSKITVIVVGNITAGGTGKTPIVMALCRLAQNNGYSPVILTRGYGGTIAGPYLVNDKDTSILIGDEAQLMLGVAPVVISHDRGKGAQWIEENIPSCDLIIMDDGMQNQTIRHDQKIAVFNGSIGIGNGMLIPSGPLREKWSSLKSCDAVMITGEDKHNLLHSIRALRNNLPILKVERGLNEKDIAQVKKSDVIAFAGIGDPYQFFEMILANGINLVSTHIYPDHHGFSAQEINALKEEAKSKNAVLVTTEKDYVRLTPEMALDINLIRLETILDDRALDILPKAHYG